MHPTRNVLIAAIALILVRTPSGVAEPMRFFARPTNGLALTPRSALGLPSYLPLRFRDLWRHQDLPVATGSLTLQVPPTAVRMLRETPARPRS